MMLLRGFALSGDSGSDGKGRWDDVPDTPASHWRVISSLRAGYSHVTGSFAFLFQGGVHKLYNNIETWNSLARMEYIHEHRCLDNTIFR
jgi:hypothetical protein